MRSKKKKEEILLQENIVDSEITNVLIGAFNRYAKEVITDRAIPDARDGLKPVQRRIIYDMYACGQVYSKPTVKSATIVGHVMGHFHPHGDASIYDALVHLSQPWKMEVPLVDFQGNNGSIDDDPAAANRYTEARLAQISEYMVGEIDKNTVKMVPTFDDKSLEPTVLPSRFPNLLVNGTQGIAVGSSTYIPPHNLGEVIDATIYRIRHKETDLDSIMKFIKAPDFPTGGLIDDKEAIQKLYETGRGSFPLYCNIEVAENEIIIKEIPYGIVKKNFVATLAKKKETDHLDNITEIVDESANEDIRISVRIKEGTDPSPILNYLQTKGLLKNTISCNFLAIDNGHPRTMPLIEVLDSFINHQREISTKAFQFDLKTALDRVEILEGYLKVQSILSEVIEKIRKASGKEGVKTMLKTDYKFTERQAEAIAMMPLYRLSNTDIVALKEEKKNLDQKIVSLRELLADQNKLDSSIIDILKAIKNKFATPRKTQILDEKQNFDSVDRTKLIAKESVYVAITADGYAKRSSVRSYQSVANLSQDIPLPSMKAGDHLVFDMLSDTHESLLLFTSAGRYAYVPVYMLQDNKWKEEGKHLNNILSFEPNEKIVKVFKVKDFYEGLNVVMLTEKNKIKKTPLSEFKTVASKPKLVRACMLSSKDDKLVAAEITTGNSDVLVVDEIGRASRFHEDMIPAAHLSAKGVGAIAAGVDTHPLVGLITLSSKEVSLLLLGMDRPAARLISTRDIPSTQRLGAKTALISQFKTFSVKIVGLKKIVGSKADAPKVICYTPESNFPLDISALNPVKVRTEVVANLKDLEDSNIAGFHDFGSVIDENFKPEEPRAKRAEPIKAKTEDVSTQLSLLDIFMEQQKGS